MTAKVLIHYERIGPYKWTGKIESRAKPTSIANVVLHEVQNLPSPYALSSKSLTISYNSKTKEGHIYSGSRLQGRFFVKRVTK